MPRAQATDKMGYGIQKYDYPPKIARRRSSSSFNSQASPRRQAVPYVTILCLDGGHRGQINRVRYGHMQGLPVACSGLKGGAPSGRLTQGDNELLLSQTPVHRMELSSLARQASGKS